MEIETGILKLLDMEKFGKPFICKQCYDDLLDTIPEAVRNTDAKDVWLAIIEYVHFKIKRDHLND